MMHHLLLNMGAAWNFRPGHGAAWNFRPEGAAWNAIIHFAKGLGKALAHGGGW